MKRENIENDELISAGDNLFKPLDDMEIPEPSASLKESFSKKLGQIVANESIDSNYRHMSLYLKVAAIAAIFIIGWFLGSLYNRNDNNLILDLQNQLENNNKLLVLSLLQQSSVSDRLQAVNVSNSMYGVDKQIIDALVNALNNDPDPNVKIKCAEALAMHLKPDSINRIFGNALNNQREPLMQLILIDYIQSIGDAESNRIIQNFVYSDKADDFVKSEVKRTFNL